MNTSVYLSICILIQHPCAHPSCPCTHLYAPMHISMHPPFTYAHIHPCIYAHIHAPTHSSIYPFTHPCMYTSIHPSIHVHIHPGTHAHIHVPISPSMHPTDIHWQPIIWQTHLSSVTWSHILVQPLTTSSFRIHPFILGYQESVLPGISPLPLVPICLKWNIQILPHIALPLDFLFLVNDSTISLVI